MPRSFVEMISSDPASDSALEVQLEDALKAALPETHHQLDIDVLPSSENPSEFWVEVRAPAGTTTTDENGLVVFTDVNGEPNGVQVPTLDELLDTITDNLNDVVADAVVTSSDGPAPSTGPNGEELTELIKELFLDYQS